MDEVNGRESPPPLLAFTASKQDQKKSGKGQRKAIGMKKTGVSKQYNSQSASRPRLRKAQGAIEFDEAARREFLTGFRKRKQARIEKGREKAKEREKVERRQLRQETREARKKQAAENVAAEHEAYGFEQSAGEMSDMESERVPLLPSAYDTEQHHTTVVVQEWNPDDVEMPLQDIHKSQVVKESLPPSSRRMAKKMKNTSTIRGAKEISRLLDSDDELLREDAEFQSTSEGRNQAGRAIKTYKDEPVKKVRKPKFRYESKMERAQAKSKLKKANAQWAEKRREERKAGGGKGRMQKGKGKRGVGGKGKKRP